MKAVVTGATGFIGGALTRRLVSKGWHVIALTRTANGLPAGVGHVEWHLGAVVPAHALEGVDVVFHVAARVGDWGRVDDYERENVQATDDLLEAAERARVGAFVFTGSPSAFLGDADVVDADETLEPPPTPLSAYAGSKLRADRLVREHRGGTRTVVVRPHAVLGEGERHLGRLIGAFVRLGVVPRIGGSEPMISVTSIDTCVDAHVAAAERLLGGMPSGRAFFVADAPAVPLVELLQAAITAQRGGPARQLELSRVLAARLAAFAEWFHAPFPKWPPIINRYRVAMLSRSHSFRVDRMASELGVRPRDAAAQFLQPRARTIATTRDEQPTKPG